MFQAFRMQFRQIVDGNRKWFVALFLVLPILLTWVAMSTGFGEVKTKLEARAAGKVVSEPLHSSAARRVEWAGEDVELADGLVVVQEERILVSGQRVRSDQKVVVNGRWIVVEDGEAWVDDGREPRGGRRVVEYRHDDFRDVPPWEVVCGIYLFLVYPQTICLLLALFYGSSLLGSEIDNKTLTYLWTRPVARWRLVWGKYLAVVAVLIPPTALSLFVSWKLMGSPAPDRLLPALLTGSLSSVLAYNAVFVLLGFLAPRRAMVLALVYGVVFEFILSFVPAMVNTLTVTYYLRSLVVEIVGIEMPREIARVVGGASLPVSIATLAAMILIGLGASSWLATHREYVVADQA